MTKKQKTVASDVKLESTTVIDAKDGHVLSSAASTWLASACDEATFSRGRATADLVANLRLDEESVAAAWLAAGDCH
jgi:hypothetical protein